MAERPNRSKNATFGMKKKTLCLLHKPTSVDAYIHEKAVGSTATIVGDGSMEGESVGALSFLLFLRSLFQTDAVSNPVRQTHSNHKQQLVVLAR